MRIEQTPERYLRAPRFTTQGDETTLHLIAWDTTANIERVVSYPVNPDGTLGAPAEGRPCEGIPALSERLEIAGFEAERQAHGASRTVRVQHEDGVASVILEHRGRSVLVWRARGMAAAPAIAETSDGAWVAWHTDVREDTGLADVAKWIVVRFVDQEGGVWEPAPPMRDRDRDLCGEEQSFEFPTLVVGADGALGLFGRGSHNFWRQDLCAEGWSARQPLSDGSWGSRGRRVAVATLPHGRVVIARRDRRGIEVDTLKAPRGGPPPLVRAPTSLEGTRPPPMRRDRSRDPARAHGLRTFFGDIQQHSAHSDGIGSAEEVYLRARWRYDDDFVALTDHESFLGKRTGPGEWEYLQQVADAHDDPGSFVTLLAYEWTGKRYPGPGHKCVYLPRRGMPIVSRDEAAEGREAVARIKAAGGIASPHHIGWTGCDEAGHDPEGQPVWEICSCHGCYEHADHPLGMRGEHAHQLADVMLRKGLRFGFTASSDSHGLLWHHGESRKRDPYRTGLTAVQCAELTRDAVFEALRNRRCYATSGAKILLDVMVNGRPMGSEIDAPSMEVEAHAVGEGPVARIDFVTEAGVAASFDGNGDELRVRGTVRGRYVYVRVVQTDGEMAWSSPVFVA